MRITSTGFVAVPALSDEGVFFTLCQHLPNGASQIVFNFPGIYGDIRDLDVLARIAALPALIDAGKEAAKSIENIQSSHQETGSGNAVLWRLKTTLRRTSDIFDTTFWKVEGVRDEEDLLESFHELDTVAAALVESVKTAASQIEYLAHKFGASDWEQSIVDVHDAVKLSKKIELSFGNDEHRGNFESWRAGSAAKLEASLARFRR
jgi:hypothetical protein